ncbi:serine hydrolase [Amycolatopsis cihanbeyliensis]
MSSAKSCSAPAANWQRATPTQAGMNPAKVAAAIEFAEDNHSDTVRIYRNGCLVGENSDTPEGTPHRAQSWSVAKSVTSLAFGRAWSSGLISPDDPVGAMFPEADIPHGTLTMRHLLTMTSGNSQRKARDFNPFMPDRVRDALTVTMIHQPGRWWNYWQSGPALVAEAVRRAAGEDFQSFVQRELFTPIGIEPGRWSWGRDWKGHTQGFFDLKMTADDYARLGELMRRGGVWNGTRLLSREYVENALRPVRPYPCYGYLIWRSATKSCNHEHMLGLPEDMFQYNGREGQLVTVFPSQGLVTVRTGHDGGEGWNLGAAERTFHDLVLGAIEDNPVATPHRPADPTITHQVYKPESIWHAPLQELRGAWRGMVQPKLAPAGPWRSRATLINSREVKAHGTAIMQLGVRVSCPPVITGHSPSCRGFARLDRTTTPKTYDLTAGESKVIWFQLDSRAASDLRREGVLHLTAHTRNPDGTRAGTTSTRVITVRPA